MLKVKRFFARWLRNEDGASALEYALMAAMVAVVVAAFVTPIGDKVKGIFQYIQEKIPAAPAD